MLLRKPSLGPVTVLLAIAWIGFQRLPQSFVGAVHRRPSRSQQIPYYRLAARPSIAGPERRPVKTMPNLAAKLLEILKSALERPVSQDELVYQQERLNNMFRWTLTLPMLDNVEFEGVAFIDKSSGLNASLSAKTNALQCAIYHVRSKFDAKLAYSSKTALNDLVGGAMGQLIKGDIRYKIVDLGSTYECTLTLPVLSEMELSREFIATADSEKDAEQAVAATAIEELSADLKPKWDERMAARIAAKKERNVLRLERFAQTETGSENGESEDKPPAAPVEVAPQIETGSENREAEDRPPAARVEVAEGADDSAKDKGLGSVLMR